MAFAREALDKPLETATALTGELSFNSWADLQRCQDSQSFHLVAVKVPLHPSWQFQLC